MEPLCSQKWSETGQKKWAQTENLFSEKSSTKTNKPPKTTKTNKQKKKTGKNQHKNPHQNPLKYHSLEQPFLL